MFACCFLAYRSVLGGLMFLLPLILSNYMTYALMGALRIGLDVNALPVVALGVGLGVDYGLYVVENIEEAYHRGMSVVDQRHWQKSAPNVEMSIGRARRPETR